MDKDFLIIDQEKYPPHPSDPEIIPEPTYWPVALAFGITLTFWGILTTLAISAVGLVTIIIALAGWIGELNHEK